MIAFSRPGSGSSLLRLPDSQEEQSSGDVRNAISRYRDLYKNPLFSRKTQEEYEKMLDDPKVQGNISAIQQNIQWLEDAISEAKEYRSRFVSKLDSAVARKLIGDTNKERWLKRFDDPSVLEWDRKEWLEKKFPAYFRNWENLAEHYEHLTAKAKKEGVDFSEIDGFHLLADENGFLNADYDLKMDLVQKGESYLHAVPRQMEKGWKSVRSLLVGLTIGEDACLHRTKVGTWMKRIFASCDTPEEVQEYLDEVLLPLVDNWKEASKEYQGLHKLGLPPSFKAVSKEKFLKWHYDQRMSYLEELRLSQEAMEKKGVTALDDQKKGIRYDMSIEDFEAANEQLIPLLQKYPQDPDLLSMERYIRLHWKKPDAVQEKSNPQIHLNRIHAYLNQANPALREKIYKPAMKKGFKTARRTGQLLYNRIWVREQGYSNDEDELEHAKSDFNKEKTREYIDSGHTKKFERNVIEGDTANAEAIREKCTSPQALYFKTENFTPVLEKIHTMRDDENYGYWTTAFLTDVDYDTQHHDVMNLQRPMLRELKALEALGYQYTDSPVLQRKGEQKEEAAETQFALAA